MVNHGYGFCQCGCGEKTTISTYNSPKYGAVKGEPRNYIQGHCPRYPKRLIRNTVFIEGVEYGVVPLTKGNKAIVDMDIYPQIMSFSWRSTTPKRGTHATYATRKARKNEPFSGRVVWMHRQILSAPPEMVVDHINHDGLDNRRINLRECSLQENIHNSRANHHSRSGIKNISLRPTGKWRARGIENGKRIHLGDFNSAEEAGRAADEHARRVQGDFAYLNF